MKRISVIIACAMVISTILLVSCSTPVGLTSWTNPGAGHKISRIVVMALFDKLTYTQPFEDQLVSYFESQNLKSIKSLDILAPFQQHASAEMKKKFDSLGTDGVLLVSYKGTDVSVNTAAGFYGGYSWWYGGGGQVWTTSTVNIRAQLFDVTKDVLIWSADLTVTNPNNITSSSQQVARAIFADWLKNNLLKNPPTPPQK